MFKKRPYIPPAKDLFNYTPLTNWDAEQAAIKLDELYKGSLALVDAIIGWYRAYRTRKGRIARFLRIVAIIFLVCSTLMPYIANLNEESKTNVYFLYTGYLLAGIGGGLLLLDRYYGFSTSWIRFVLTGFDLENFRNYFVEHWQVVYLQNIPLTKTGFCTLVNEITAFRESVNGAVKAETETWAQEFQQSFKELSSALKDQSDQLKGSLEQKRLQTKQTAQSQLSPKVNEIEEQIPDEVFQEAIKKNFDVWKKQYDIQAVAYGKKRQDSTLTEIDCLVFIPKDKPSEDQVAAMLIPSVILFKSDSGKIYELPTDVRSSGGTFRASAIPALLCDKNIPKRPGCSISRINDENKDDTGTLGLKVFKANKVCILTCYHVACAQELERGHMSFSEPIAVGSRVVVSPSREDTPDEDQGLPLGHVMEGELNDILDGAIIEVLDTVTIRDKICSIDLKPNGKLNILKEHADAHHAVISVGRTSGVVQGTIEFHDTFCDVEYMIDGVWKWHRLNHIILSNQRTRLGDSGASVIDHNNKVIGIVAATSGEFTCIVPIERLLNKFEITLTP